MPDFIEPENWLTTSSDLNSVDYSIWGAHEQVVYLTKIRDVIHLKEVLLQCWEEIRQNLISSASDHAVVQAHLHGHQ